MSTVYSKSFVRVDNPQALLALNVFLEAFKNIESYYTGEGDIEERIEGKYGIRWIRKMEGNFKVLASASGMSVEKFHMMCLNKINKIKKEAYEKKCMGQQDK
jgi:hypothetical protein